ncbi:hypothetical protein [Ramlibacter rhizophilus]|uniref:hypothetical protein n=1 Tax=Ramlibacter rhizophilus TaxID=1781167 RepID=UPI0014325DB2|nr:hypothetical protein [Ramlibacter rhizophilus]
MRRIKTARARAASVAQRRARMLRIGIMGLVLAGGAWFAATAEAGGRAAQCMGML